MTPKTRRVLLGEIGPAHGIRGEVLVKTYTGAPEDIAAYGPLEDEAGRTALELTFVRATPKGAVTRVAGVADRTAAEKLRGTKLYVARDRLPATDTGEFYHTDLIGLRAMSPTGDTLGEIIAVHNFGAGDLLEIRRASNKSTEFVPLRQAFVPNVDVAIGQVTVILPVMAADEDGEIENDGG